MDNKDKKEQTTIRAVISGYYGFDNFGDEAILNVLVNQLKSENIDVTVFSKNPQKTSSSLGVMSVGTFSLSKVIRAIKNTDVLISGGGSLLQDATSLKSLAYYLFVISTALFFKKKVIIFAQGIGPIRNYFGQLWAKAILKKCTYITVRDEKSLFRVRGWGAKSDLVNDPVWNIELREKFPLDRVGVQLRSWRTLTGKYIFSLARQVALNFSDKEIYIYSFQDALDLEICKKFEGYLKLANPDIKTVIIKTQSIDEVVQSFSNLEYLIGMRYHACLLALKYGIKTLALSYDEKVEKLAKRFDLPYLEICRADNLEEKFDRLKKLDSKELSRKANSVSFDFSKIIEAIEE